MTRRTFPPLILLCVLVLLQFASCHRPTGADRGEGDTLRLKYARHLVIVHYPHYDIVHLKNPWKTDGSDLHAYVLVPRADSAVAGPLPDGTVVYTPVRRSVLSTAPHCQLLYWLGAQRAVTGMMDLAYVHIAAVRRRAAAGTLADCGSSMSPNVERIAELSPEALFVSPYEHGTYGALAKMGIPLIECADYMETTALGRAEWMRFYGRLYGCGARADSLFSVVERTYQTLSSRARRSAARPLVLTERKTGGIWYCPGGRSSMGTLLADAGARTPFSEDTHSGSLSLSPEVVLDKAADCDVWLFMNDRPRPLTRADLLAEYPGYAQLKAFARGRVYECACMSRPYFEEISFRPDFLLRELVTILHPETGGDDSLRYYERMPR